ncbi:MAG TPA: EamA family transporter [Verrucomicrobiae bacterium]|nr:EamA family transporter [Verrucomicrobiae bacterium]
MRPSLPTHKTAARWQIATAFASIYLFWGSTYLAIRLAVETLPPFSMAGARALVAGSLLYAWTRWRGAPRPEPVHWRAAAIVGGFLLLGGNGLVSWSEQRVPSGIAALIVGSVPLWMALLEWLWHSGPRPTVGIVLGLFVGFAGLGFLVAPGKLGDMNRIDPLGAGALLLAAFLWGSGSLYSRRARLPASQLMAASMEMLAGGALLLLAGGLTGEWLRFEPTRVVPHSIVAWAYLIVFGSLVGFTAYVWLLKATTPARASTYAYVNPVVAVVLGWAFAGEPITPRVLMAAAAIILAVVIIVTRSTETPVEM